MSGETEDVLEEIKRMAEGLQPGIRTGISESVTNRNASLGNTDATGGSKDLKI